MAEPFVQVRLSRIFRTLRTDLLGFRDDVVADAAKVLRTAQETSIRARWYDTGATLSSLQEEFVTDGPKRIYRLWPTARSKGGAPYPLFGEYGTGRVGAATGKPAPTGYRYGNQPGMAARRYSRLAVVAARPAIDQLARAKAAQFAARMTVN